MKLSFTKEEHEEFIKNHFQIKTAHVIDEENEMYYVIPVKEDYTKHDRVIAKTQAEKFGFVFGDGLMVLDYKPIKPTCANYERDNVETETYTITADKYFHQEFKKLVNIDTPILSEMEQNVATYITGIDPYQKNGKDFSFETFVPKRKDIPFPQPKGNLKNYDSMQKSILNGNFFAQKDWRQELMDEEFRKLTVQKEKVDPIVESVRQKLLDRSNVGIKKYNTTLDSNNKDNYLKHAQEEAMDLANYLEKLMQQKEDITQIVAKYPNNMELGSEIRKIYGK